MNKLGIRIPQQFSFLPRVLPEKILFTWVKPERYGKGLM